MWGGGVKRRIKVREPVSQKLQLLDEAVCTTNRWGAGCVRGGGGGTLGWGLRFLTEGPLGAIADGGS